MLEPLGLIVGQCGTVEADIQLQRKKFGGYQTLVSNARE